MDKKIKITKNGPYLVSGSIPLDEKSISEDANGYVMTDCRSFAVGEQYALCRCGQSKNMPFCDASHIKFKFDGIETASIKPYLEQAEVIEGPDLILTDLEDLCALARFCHTAKGDVWELTEESDNTLSKKAAIKAASECTAGRLVAWDKETGKAFEPDFIPSISIIYDQVENVIGPIWVKGGIEIENSDGVILEKRNRVTLCRCGKSSNKPFCNGIHVYLGEDI